MYVLTIEEGPVGVYSTLQNLIDAAKEYAGECAKDVDFTDVEDGLEELGMYFYCFVLDDMPV